MKQIKDVFSLILRQVPDLTLFVLDRNGNFLIFSESFKKLVKAAWGVTLEENNNIFTSLSFHEDSVTLENEFKRALSGEIFESTEHYGDVNFSRKYYTSKWTPLIKEDQIIGTICTMNSLMQTSINIEDGIDSEKMFKIFFDLSSDGLIWTELDIPIQCSVDKLSDDKIIELLENEKVSYVNQAMLQQLQMSKEKIIGISLRELFDYPLENVIRDYSKLLKQKRMELISYESKSDGSDVWIEGNYVTICNEKNEMIGHLGSRRDVTNRVKAEESVEHTQYLLNYIIEHDRTAVAVHDKEMKYIYVSEKYKEELGVKNIELIGQSYYDVFPETKLKWREIHGRALHGEVLRNDDDIYVRKSGIRSHVRWECRPWYDANEEIGGIIIYIENIDEEKRISNILKINELRLNALFAQAAIGISYGSLSNEFDQVNQKLCEIMGYTAEEFRSLSYFDLCHPLHCEEYNQNRIKLLNKEIDNFILESRFIKKNEDIIWANVTFSLIENDEFNDPYIMMIFEDITKRKQTEEEMIFLNYHDQLTGVYNRRFYEEELKRLDTSRNLPISLIVADANGLKLINDAFGHVQGDEMIKRIANAFVEECRSDDIIARIGGDEFVVLLANTRKEEAENIAARITQSLEEKNINQAPITISLGIATKETKDEKIIEVFNEAEAMMYRNKLDHRSEMMSATIQIILDTFFKQNEYEKNHAHRVSEMCYEVGKHMHFESQQLEKLKVAGLMHDIGKVNIPSSILNKITKLSKHDWEEIMRHSEIGYHILSAVSEFAEISEYVLAHHERWDGKGYPKGLAKDKIPLASRIISVVDAYDTMVNSDLYSKPLSQEEAIAELRRMSNIQFDSYIVEVFIQNKVYDTFKAGSKVVLKREN